MSIKKKSQKLYFACLCALDYREIFLINWMKYEMLKAFQQTGNSKSVLWNLVRNLSYLKGVN